jgi:DNA topoisomerase I
VILRWPERASPLLDARGNRITDESKLGRIDALRIPPAWNEVWISSRAGSSLQATGTDAAGRRQCLYHPEFRVRQEQEKYGKLIQFAERLFAVRLIDLTWFRVGSERYARESSTYGVTTLTMSAREIGLDLEEPALLSLLRSWRIRNARKAA